MYSRRHTGDPTVCGNEIAIDGVCTRCGSMMAASAWYGNSCQATVRVTEEVEVLEEAALSERPRPLVARVAELERRLDEHVGEGVKH